MRSASRLFRIIQLLRATGRVMTAAEIAERVEVSQRTIYRDMEHLIGSGAPIDGERGVGYLLRENFDAPPLTFTFEQLEVLSFGLRAVRMLGDEKLGQVAGEVMDKIEAMLPQEHAARLKAAPLRAFRSFTTPKPPDMLSEIHEAIAGRHKVGFDYLSLAGDQTSRVVHPLGLSVFGNIWLMTSWCELRNDFRDFRVDRMGAFLRLRDRFEPSAERSFDAYLARYRSGRGTFLAVTALSAFVPRAACGTGASNANHARSKR